MRMGLMGQTLSHSMSVPIHELYYKKTGIDATYDLVELPPDRIDCLRELMLGEGFVGLNVTIPYKQAVVSLMDELTDAAKQVGAINTIHYKKGSFIGHNTDLFGFERTLRRADVDVKNKTCAVLGATGGAAQAVICQLLNDGAEKIYLVGRDGIGRNAPDTRCIWTDYYGLRSVCVDIIVNCTPVGMFPDCDRSPVNEYVCTKAEVLIDLIYNPTITRFMAYGQENGKKVVGGLYMLVAQAVAAECMWQERAVDHQITDAIYGEIQAEYNAK